MKTKFVLLVLSILMILVSGCVNKESGPVSTPVPTESPITEVKDTYVPIITTIPTITSTPTITPIPTVTTTESPTIISTPVVQVYSIGKSVNNSNTKMTLNSIRYTQSINYKNADIGKQFLIIDVTIENIGTDKNLSYSGDQFIILDSNEDIESIYGEDTSSLELAKHFNGGNISPGDKRQGELSFDVPTGAKGLQLKFEYSPDPSGTSQSEFFTLDQ